jgi:POT family proton-dependent oligopeptide transporter
MDSRHPTGFWFVFWGELAERASYYGMRTLLALYLVDALRYGTPDAASIVQFFMAACYITPVLGGWIADRFLGRYRTIAFFALPYILGHLILGGIDTRTGLFIALPLLALGSGAIKPNTSTLMGMIYVAEKKERLLGQAFSWFYAAINVGSAIASFSLPLVRNQWGYSVALAIPAGLMAAAFACFAAGRRHYPAEPRQTLRPVGAEGALPALRRLAPTFLLIAIFWFVYDQSASTWVFFARDHLDLRLFPGVTISPDQIQALNPVFVLMLTPVFNALWRAIEARSGRPVPATRKMLLGFVIVIGAMATMALAGTLAGDGKISAWWEIAATFVITLAELCISVVGLELAFQQAGPGAKSAVTAVFLAMVFVGDTIGGFFAQSYGPLAPGAYFGVQTLIIAVAALLFRLAARRFEAPARSEGGRVIDGGALVEQGS